MTKTNELLEIAAWRTRFPQYEYRVLDDCIALKIDHAFGCHCDLDAGMSPDKCVMDEGKFNDCVFARKLFVQGKGKENALS